VLDPKELKEMDWLPVELAGFLEDKAKDRRKE
jgi:hypothetical protein